MYTIIVYDVSVERVNKVCQFLRQNLHWIQNSVFEGELSESHLQRIKQGLKNIINEKEDSVLFFTIANKNWLKKERLGIEKNDTSCIL